MGYFDDIPDKNGGVATTAFDTQLTPNEETKFQQWKAKYAPNDSGADYDLRGAFKAGLTPSAETGHWPDTYKKPNHPTFSDQSIYASAVPYKAGHWNGEQYTPTDYFADIEENSAVAYGRQLGFDTSDIKKLVATAPEWQRNAAEALAETVQGFIPRSVKDLANFLTPVAGLPDEAKQLYSSAHRLIAGGNIDETIKETYPESQVLAEAEKTPAYSKERFKAGFGTIADLLMGAGITRGLRAHDYFADIETTKGGEANAISNKASIEPGIAAKAAAGGTEEFARFQQQGQGAGESGQGPIDTGPASGPQQGSGGEPQSQVEPLRGATGEGGQAEAGPGEIGPGTERRGDREAQRIDQESGAGSPVAEPASGSAPSGAAPGELVAPPLVEQAPQTFKSFAELPAEVVAPAPKERAPRADGGFAEHPLVQFIRGDLGGIMSKSTARAKWGKQRFEANKSLWDSAPEFPDPRHNKIYAASKRTAVDAEGNRTTYDTGKLGMAPDEAANAAVEAGLLPEGADASDLFQAVGKVADSSHRIAKQERGQAAEIKTGEKQFRSFTTAIAKQSKGERPVSASDLAVGDHVTVNGEQMKVIDIDPDNYDVTLEDGARFGVQHVGDQQVFYGEHTPAGTTAAKGGEFGASKIAETTGATEREVRPQVGKETSLRQQGEAAETGIPQTPKVGLNEAQRALMSKLARAEGSLSERGRAQLERLRSIERAATPQLRPGEKGTGDLLQGADQPFNLAGETGIDYEARQRAAEAAATQAHDAAVEAEKAQTIFGFGPGAASIYEPLGSHIKQLTETVTKELRGPRRPRSVAERINRVIQRIGGKLVSARETIGRAADNARAVYTVMKDALLDPVKYSDYKEAVKDMHFADSRREHEVSQWVRKVEGAIKDPLTEEGITNYIQAAGDEALLRERAQTSNIKYRPGYEAALKLTEEQKALAKNIGQYHEAMLDDGIKAGILEHGLENYITQVWKKRNRFTNALEADVQMGKLQVNPSFAKRRIFGSYFDGEQAGYAPANKRAGALLAHYDQSFGRALSARAFIKSLREAKAIDGEPVAKFAGSTERLGPEDAPPEAYLIRPRAMPETAEAKDGRPYQIVDHPALRKWKFAVTDADGATAFYQADMLVHPNHAAALRNMLESSKFRTGPLAPYVSPLFKVGAVAKQTKLSLSGFHLTQEAVHALSHRVLPFNLPKINFDDPIQARLIRGGVQVADFRAQNLFQEGLAGGGLTAKIPVLGQLQLRFNNWLFRDYIPRLKMKMAMEAFDRNMSRYGPETKTAFTADQVAELTASQANAAFGEMNYKLLGRSATTQDFLKLTVLAPDFLEARTRFIAQALKPYGREQRAALFVMGATLYAGGRVLNQLLDNNPHWDMPFSVVHDGRQYRLRTLLGDAFEVGTDPRRFFYNRMSPFTKTAYTWFSGRDYRGVKLTNFEQVKDALSWLVPISVGGNEPATEAQRLLGAMGVSNKPAPTAIDDAYKWAREFKTKRAKTDPKIAAEVRRSEQETYAGSDYARINAALRDGDNERAVTEMTKLMRERGKDPDVIGDYYDNLPERPFTGSEAMEDDFVKQLDQLQQSRYKAAVQLREQMARRAIKLLPYAERALKSRP